MCTAGQEFPIKHPINLYPDVISPLLSNKVAFNKKNCPKFPQNINIPKG